ALGDLRVLVKRGEDKDVVVEARIPRLVQAPVRLREPLGDVVVRRGDQELGRVAVVAEREVPATGWLSWLWNRRMSSSMTPYAASPVRCSGPKSRVTSSGSASIDT